MKSSTKYSTKYLDKHATLVFKDETPKDLADFLDLLYFKRATTISTKTGRTIAKGKGRSAEDGYRTAKSYFPNLSYEGLRVITHELVDEKIFHWNFCSTCGRIILNKQNILLDKSSIKKALSKLGIENIKANELRKAASKA